jgi:hypothetical protein
LTGDVGRGCGDASRALLFFGIGGSDRDLRGLQFVSFVLKNASAGMCAFAAMVATPLETMFTLP